MPHKHYSKKARASVAKDSITELIKIAKKTKNPMLLLIAINMIFTALSVIFKTKPKTIKKQLNVAKAEVRKFGEITHTKVRAKTPTKRKSKSKRKTKSSPRSSNGRSAVYPKRAASQRKLKPRTKPYRVYMCLRGGKKQYRNVQVQKSGRWKFVKGK